MDFIIQRDEPILLTGATGFIGPRVVENLLQRGYRNLRCIARPSSNTDRIKGVEVIPGNLLSRADCLAATRGAKVILHLAAGRGEKSFPDAFMNSVVTTRNLLEAVLSHGCLKRFVSISSFSVYANDNGQLLDEASAIEPEPQKRGDAYSFAKIKQDELVLDYAKRFGVPTVIVRPGYVYGPGNEAITGRVGIGSFGVFLHLGGSNRIPFTYVDNCAEAIVLAGLRPGVDGEVFNVVDDDLPTSRQFLRAYKRNVRRFRSVYVPHFASYALCYLWEKYCDWSEGQLPPVYNRKTWNVGWRKTRYTNQKLKTRLGWTPKINSTEAFARYFESCRLKQRHA